MFFDGACRANGSTAARASCGCYSPQFGYDYSRGMTLPNVVTNNAAEIDGAGLALEFIGAVIAAHPNRNLSFVVYGDSEHVIAALKSGRILAYRQSDRLPNSSNWVRLQTSLLHLDGEVELTWRWVPRIENVEADEACNAALDGRAINTDLHSPVIGSSMDLTQLIDKCLESLTTRRVRTIRTLPTQLGKTWRFTLFTFFRMFEGDMMRKLFWLLPRLLAIFTPQIRNRGDFMALSNHITNLTDKRYLAEALSHLLVLQTLDKLPEPAILQTPASSTTSQTARATTLASRGLFPKIIDDDNVTIADAANPMIQTVLNNLFPKETLPPHLTTGPPLVVSFGLLIRGFMKLKRGKSPGCTGWTRELLYPLFIENQEPKIQSSLIDIFSCIINVSSLTPIETLILRSSILIPFQVDPIKIRPIVLIEVLTKLALGCLLSDIPTDPNVAISGFTHNMRGNSGVAIHVVQAALNDGRVVIACDAPNSFNTARREPALKYLQSMKSTYGHLFPLINALYCTPSDIVAYGKSGFPIFTVVSTSGTRQGCVTGPPFLMWTTMRSNLKFPNSLVQVMDDVHIVAKDSVAISKHVFDEYASVGQVLNGKKLRLISFGPIDIEALPPHLQNAELCICTPTKILGGLVSPPVATWEITRKALDPKLKKIENRANKIAELQSTVQIKFLIVLTVSRWYSYFAASLHTPWRDRVLALIDELHVKCFTRISGLDVDASHVPRVQSSLEDGGLGILPYSIFGQLFFEAALLNAIPMLKRFRLPHDLPQPRIGRNHTDFLWSKHSALTNQRIAAEKLPSWLTTWPTNQMTRIEDEVFQLGLSIRLNNMKPRDIWCPRAGNLKELTPAAFTSHFLGCPTCGGKHYIIRHEKVVHALKQSLTFYGTPCAFCGKELPLPSNRKGGPDLKVFGRELEVIDVSIARFKKNLNGRYNTKMRKYRAFIAQTSLRVTPFVMDATGEICKKSRDRLLYWTKDMGKQAFSACYTHMQIELLRGMNEGLRLLLAMNILTQEHRKLEIERLAQIGVEDTDSEVDDIEE